MLSSKKEKKNPPLCKPKKTNLQALCGLGLPALTSGLETNPYGMKRWTTVFGNELLEMGWGRWFCYRSSYFTYMLYNF